MSEKTDKDLDFTSLKPLEVLYEEALEELLEKETKEATLPEIKVNLKDNNTVALFATGHISQAKWGELSKGYNIVNKEAADFWLAHRTVRLATPEEVAKHYGVK
jgi:hypothetical protein